MDTNSQNAQTTPAQILNALAAEDRNRARVATEGVAALKRLYEIALRDTGQC
jgi:hypothetical protein